MIAFLSYAGGMAEYRFFQHEGEIEVQRWHLDDGKEMVRDKEPSLIFSDMLRALIAIADHI